MSNYEPPNPSGVSVPDEAAHTLTDDCWCRPTTEAVEGRPHPDDARTAAIFELRAERDAWQGNYETAVAALERCREDLAEAIAQRDALIGTDARSMVRSALADRSDDLDALGEAELDADSPSTSPSTSEPHPEDFCESCGGPNIVWWVDSNHWNKATDRSDILCPICFVQRWTEATGLTKIVWELRIDPRSTHAREQTAERTEVVHLPPAASPTRAVLRLNPWLKHGPGCLCKSPVDSRCTCGLASEARGLMTPIPMEGSDG